MLQSDIDALEQRMVELARQKPVFYADFLHDLGDVDYRMVMLAFGQIRQKRLFNRDDKGRYVAAPAAQPERPS
jgi:hypothetical protein